MEIKARRCICFGPGCPEREETNDSKYISNQVREKTTPSGMSHFLLGHPRVALETRTANCKRLIQSVRGL